VTERRVCGSEVAAHPQHEVVGVVAGRERPGIRGRGALVVQRGRRVRLEIDGERGYGLLRDLAHVTGGLRPVNVIDIERERFFLVDVEAEAGAQQFLRADGPGRAVVGDGGRCYAGEMHPVTDPGVTGVVAEGGGDDYFGLPGFDDLAGPDFGNE